MVDGLTTLAADAALRSGIALHNTSRPPAQDWPRTLGGFDDLYERARSCYDLRRRTASRADRPADLGR